MLLCLTMRTQHCSKAGPKMFVIKTTHFASMLSCFLCVHLECSQAVQQR